MKESGIFFSLFLCLKPSCAGYARIGLRFSQPAVSQRGALSRLVRTRLSYVEIPPVFPAADETRRGFTARVSAAVAAHCPKREWRNV